MKDIIYSNLKIFHFKEKLLSLPHENIEILPPLHIRIKPTNICNHSCSYCSYRKDNLQLGKGMNKNNYISKEKMSEIIEDMEELGVKAVTFSGGGEPFCYPYLLDTLKRLSKTSVKFALLTNGEKLSGEIAEFVSHFASWVRISIDGWDNKSYSIYRNVKDGTHTKIIQNMKDFKHFKGKCSLGVSIIVDKYNASHIYELIENLKDIGVNSIKVSPCIISDSVKENNNYHDAIFNNVKETICKSMSNLSDENFEIIDSYHKLDEVFEKNYTWCPFLQILPVIGADLNLYSCQDKAYNRDTGLIGSIGNCSFKNLWFSDKNIFFKINPAMDCNHHCIANLKNKLIIEYLEINKDHLEFV